jgi:hypothetical protein
MTTVFNMQTADELTYSLPAAVAVVAAFEQDRGNWNTWTYPTPENHPLFAVGKYSVSCGDFSAMKDSPALQDFGFDV